MRFFSHFVFACCLFVVSPLFAQPSIDGFVDDDFWSSQARVWRVEKEGDAQQAASFWLGHDSEYLYFAADVQDVDVRGTETGRKAEVWKDDAVEMFISFGDGNAEDRTAQTFEYGFSAAGGVSWTRGTGMGDGEKFPGHDWPPQWDSQVEWSTRVKSGSTLNLSADTDRGYVVEARIPWSELEQSPPFEDDRRIGILFLNVLQPGPDGDKPGLLSSVPGITFANNHKPRLWERIRINWMGPLPVRGLVEDLPLWLGTSADGGYWKQYKPAESDKKGPWLDRRYWTDLLKEMKRLQFNALLLEHPHPFNGFLTLKDFPKSAHFNAEQLKQNADQLTWLINQADKRNVRVYLSCRNIHLPDKWAQGAGSGKGKLDGPEVRRYMREVISKMFETFPGLEGLMITSEDPAADVEFVHDTIVKGLAQVKTGDEKPHLLFHTWGSYPEHAARIIEAWPNTTLLQDIQGRQWFLPRIDPRVPRYENKVRALTADKNVSVRPTVAIGGPQSALRHVFWGDPEWMHKLNLDLRRHGCDGMFLKTENVLPWITREAMGKYACETESKFDRRFWEQRLNAVYGTGRHSGQLLETMQHASAIIPELLKLMHNQSPRYMPQFGLQLTEYMGLPTISSYVTGYEFSISEQGYLEPLFGPTWPNPDWGLEVATVRDSLEYGGPVGEIEADDIANRIRQHASACRSRLNTLRHVQPPNEDQQERWSSVLDHLTMCTALGEHYASKIKAALGWTEYTALRGRTSGIYSPLQGSIDAWEKVCELAEKIYDSDLPYWQQQPYSPPPWGPGLIHKRYQAVQGHWRNQLELFKREMMLIREYTGLYNTDAPLPLWDLLTAVPDKGLRTAHTLYFESEPDNRYELNFAHRTEQGTEVIHGKGSLLVDTRNQGGGWHTVLKTVPANAPMLAYRRYQVSMNYYVVEAEQNEDMVFGVGLKSAVEDGKVTRRIRWKAPKDYFGVRKLQTSLLENDNMAFFLEVKGPAVLVVDNLEINLIEQ